MEIQGAKAGCDDCIANLVRDVLLIPRTLRLHELMVAMRMASGAHVAPSHVLRNPRDSKGNFRRCVQAREPHVVAWSAACSETEMLGESEYKKENIRREA